MVFPELLIAVPDVFMGRKHGYIIRFSFSLKPVEQPGKVFIGNVRIAPISVSIRRRVSASPTSV